LNVTAIQSDIFWENPKKNTDYLDEILSGQVATDLVILPEMFTTGFSMNASKVAEKDLGESCLWMQQKAKQLNATIIGSIPTIDNGNFYNRLYVASPDNINHYDKRHLFSMAKENLSYSSGSSDLIIQVKEFKIKPLICYDLRFPIWSRNKLINDKYDYDVLIYIANWPELRSNAWVSLLQARAIENLSYVIGVNRVGKDFNGINYNGSSRVYNFKGDRIDDFLDNEVCVSQVFLDKSKLDNFRIKFPALNDADRFNLLN
jgi:predicted amidohydrolase